MATEQILFEFEVKGGEEALKEATRLGQAIRENKQEIKELNKNYEKNADEIEQLNNLNKQLSAEQRNLAKSARSVEGSYNALSAEMAELKRRQKEVNVTTAQGRKQYNEYSKRINKLNDELKDLDKKNGVFVRNVGNYAGQLNIMGVNVGQVSSQFTQAGKSVNQLGNLIGGTSKMLRLLSKAFIATGIGAFILALVSLVTYFSKTREGGETIRVLFKQIGQVVNVLIERIGIFGKGIFDILTGNFKEGVQGLTSAFKGMGDELEREVALIKELEERAIKLEKAEILLNAQRSNMKRQIKDLQLLAEQENVTLGTRISAIEKAIELQKNLNALEVETQKQKIQNILGEVEGREKLDFVLKQLDEGFTSLEEASSKANVIIDQIGLDPSTVEDLRTLVDEYIKFNDTQSQALKLERTLTTRLNELRNKADKDLKESGVAGVMKVRVRALEDAATAAEKYAASIDKVVKAENVLEGKTAEIIHTTDEYAQTLLKTQQIGEASFNGIAMALGEMVGSGQTSLQSFKKIILLSLLDTLQGMIPVLTAQIFAQSLAQPDSVATFGVSAAGRVAILDSLLIGAVQGAKSYVNSQFARGGLTDGGMFEGASHAQGGIKFKVGGRIHEAEGGEAIINKRSTAMFKPLLSAINTAGGGVKFAKGGIPNMPSMNNMINNTYAEEQLNRLEKAMIKTKYILSIPTATSVQNDIAVTETNATL